ncbi:MAG: helix-turn-helix domain-containing protein [Chloroflexota bacterium]|jgi:AcrR family transcriptional regulator|nr:helix-turn-helix domain-containing protein [Chloroflexota bacterium]
MPKVRLPADRRQSLLSAARRVFASKGYEAATVSEIVAEAGVAQGTFYLYFPSKRAAVVQLADEFHRRLAEAVMSAYRPDRPLVESVRPTVEAAFRVCAENVDLLRLLDLDVARDMEACREMQATPAHQELQAWLGEVIGQHAAREGIALDPEMLARIILWMMREATYECFVLGGGQEVERYIDAISSFLEAALLGLERPSRGPTHEGGRKR